MLKRNHKTTMAIFALAIMATQAWGQPPSEHSPLFATPAPTPVLPSGEPARNAPTNGTTATTATTSSTRTYTRDPVIQVGEIHVEGNRTTLAPGESVRMWIDTPSDFDSWTDGNSSGQEEDNTLFAKWSNGADGYSIMWTAPDRQGEYKPKVTVNDDITRGSTNGRNDLLVEKSVTINVVRPTNGPVGYEYSAATPIDDTTNGNYSIPYVKDNITVSPNEQIVFNIEASDTDSRHAKTNPAGAEEDVTGTGPYEIQFVVTGEADFDSPGSGSQTKPIRGLSSGNVSLYTRASWTTGSTGITVKATIVDKAPALSAPNSGTMKDPDKVIIWRIYRRGTSPTSIHWVDGRPQGTWVPAYPAPAGYTYEVGPDIGPVGHPDYENQTVLESFGVVTANGYFTMADLQPAWVTAHPTLTTPDSVAAFLFNSGSNGTFVIDSQDRIYDQHGGFGETSAFTSTALLNGVGYRLPQNYSAGPNTLGNYTIDRRYMTIGGIEVNKSGP